jgi:hypothetical protein
MGAEVQRVPAEDVPHVGAADHDELEPDLLSDTLQTGWAHLPGRSDREAVAGNQEGLAAVDPLPEVGHQVAERTGLPAFVEGLECLRHAVGGRRDLVGVDGIALPARPRRVPGAQGLATDETGRQPIMVVRQR